MTPDQIRAAVLRHVVTDWRSSSDVANAMDGDVDVGWVATLDALHELVEGGHVERAPNDPIVHTFQDGSTRTLHTSKWRLRP